MDTVGYNGIQHAQYSPDLAPFDFAFFSQLKSDLNGQRFSDFRMNYAQNQILK